MAKATIIVIPLYKQFSMLNQYELISFNQSCKILNKYKFSFVTHEGIDVDSYVSDKDIQYQVNIFDSSYFDDIDSYNRLLLAKQFYQSFANFRFILICQLDVFIFSDMLARFEQLNYDYIGAPWFQSFGSAVADTKILGVGNGGLSLRKVSSALRILAFFDAFKPTKTPLSTVEALLKSPVSLLKVVKHEIVRRQHHYPTVLPWLQVKNEDIYWSMYLKGFFSWYRVAAIEDAIAFAFEARPELLYSMNGNQLPMGAHAWQKYNLSFWQPHIKALGYEIKI